MTVSTMISKILNTIAKDSEAINRYYYQVVEHQCMTGRNDGIRFVRI